MIRLRYPNITPCEMMFYRISSARHYHTSLQHPRRLSVSLTAPLDRELPSAPVLCFGFTCDLLPSQCPTGLGLPTAGSAATPQALGSPRLRNSWGRAMLTP